MRISGILLVMFMFVVKSSFGQTKPQSSPAKPAATNQKAVEAGAKLVAASDCKACHDINNKLVGPAYKEVAKKYPNTPENVNKLAAKIIQGGKGVWGQIPMAPHASLKKEDAVSMVKYILSLK